MHTTMSFLYINNTVWKELVLTSTMTTSITIQIPTGREDSAEWLLQQEPNVVADALQFTWHAFATLRSELNDCDVGRLQYEKQSLERNINELKKAHAIDIAETERTCFAKSDEAIANLRAQYQEDTRKLQCSIDEARAKALEEGCLRVAMVKEQTQKQLQQERDDMTSASEQKIQAVRDELASVTVELQKRRGDEALIRE